MWSYTFTNYAQFLSIANALMPQPNWPPGSDVNIPPSTTPPSHETDYNAVNFPLWKQLGRDFLIKSNINNLVVCSPDTGSLVELQEGTIICKIVKRVTDMCSEVPPPSFVKIGSRCGPVLKGSQSGLSVYYFFDGCTGRGVPVHDPCGEYGDNGLQNVENPHGNIFVR